MVQDFGLVTPVTVQTFRFDFDLFPESAVITFCAAAKTALSQAQTVSQANKVVKSMKLLQKAIELRNLSNESAMRASEMAIEAERRTGELLQQQAEKGERQKVGRPKLIIANDDNLKIPTLAEQGLTRDESSRYQKLASINQCGDKLLGSVAEGLAFLRRVNAVESDFLSSAYMNDADHIAI